jgi:hypothetical protein
MVPRKGLSLEHHKVSKINSLQLLESQALYQANVPMSIAK